MYFRILLSSSSDESFELSLFIKRPFLLTAGSFPSGFVGLGEAVTFGGSRVKESFMLSCGSCIEMYISLGELCIGSVREAYCPGEMIASSCPNVKIGSSSLTVASCGFIDCKSSSNSKASILVTRKGSRFIA